jgi:flagellar protein FlaG
MITIQNSTAFAATAAAEALPRKEPVKDPAQVATAMPLKPEKSEKPKKTEPTPAMALADPKKMHEELAEAIEKLNKQMEAGKRGLGFSVDDELNMTIITVKNTSTGEIVRQIPSEAVIRVAHKIEDLKGILYSKDV